MMQKKRYLLFLLLSIGLFLLLQSCGGAAPAPTEEEPAAEEPVVQPTMTVAPLLTPLIPVTGGGDTPTPAPTMTQDVPVAPPAATPVPRIPEQRRLTLEFPPKIRAGDSDIIRLTLEIDEMGNIAPTAEIEGNTVVGEVIEIPNLYDTHTIIAQSRLDMAGVQVIPEEMISQPLLPGKSVTFLWSIRPSEAGKYRGTVWFYLRFIPNDGSPETTRTISAQFVEVNATTFFGVKAVPARWLGAIGSFISGVLGMPLIDEVLKWLWRNALGVALFLLTIASCGHGRLVLHPFSR
ncbi:MAG: hypothetical protein HN855_11590 [Anaerolineae bacterium]|jgi:hypothetical protein|nr:hypothetical protein [Anaerolineae bacterium]MBT7325795.1 hypothetical protein [Anaerolineae bacterium]